MRLIFIVLLVGNIAFLISQLIGEKTPEVAAKSQTVTRQYGNLQTLGERDAKAGKALKSEIKKSADNSSATVSSADRCELIGPFAELLHAEYLIERLGALDVSASIKNIEIVDGKNYWVYLKPEMSEKEALRRLYEIQAKSIDSYIIPSGELANGISFGQFAELNAAKEKAELIRQQGYSADVKEVPKSHNEVWVELKEQSAQKINAEHWASLLKEEKAIERRENYCLGVAN